LRIAGADPAGFAIAENMRSQIQGYKAAKMNSENATSFVQIAEGALNEQNNILIRMRELAVQAASDTYSDTERGYLNDEFKQINAESDRIAQNHKIRVTIPLRWSF
jgi:flagellin